MCFIDCPECEGELTIHEKVIDDIVITTVFCSNCDWKDSDEPDWDSMKGGVDYDDN